MGKNYGYTKIEEITPARARTLLAGYTPRDEFPRPYRQKVAEKYAEVMASGNWGLSSSSPLVFTSEGWPVNGIHRLKAVVLYGKPVQFWTMYEQPDVPHEEDIINKDCFRMCLEAWAEIPAAMRAELRSYDAPLVEAVRRLRAAALA